MKQKITTAILILFFFPLVLTAQEVVSEDTPPWLIMEMGKTAYSEGDFGTAFRLFRAALEEKRPLPEAHMWTAIIYEEEGEYELAENHYLKALSESRDLYILQDAFLIRYRLADMYVLSRQFGKYERVLRDIIATDEISVEEIALRNAMTRNLRESGIDKLIELYRIDISPCTRAYASLGIFYYRTGRFSESIENLIPAVLDTISTCIDDITENNPAYEVNNAEDLLSDCLEDPRISAFIGRVSFFEHLYYLACALFAESERSHADRIWTLVRECSGDDELEKRASQQLRAPFIEPVLTLTRS